MGFDNARIVLDNPNNTYYAGQTLNGRLLFSRDKVKKFRGIYVHLRGYCKVHWTSRERNPHSHSEHDRHRTVNHDSYEDYFDHKIYLSGSSSGDHHLPAGQHDLPFSIRIPDNCPSAFEGEYGHVRYELRVVVDKAYKIDQELTAPIKILAPLDLNMVPNARDPINIKMEDSYCCWCVNAGSSETLIELPSTGYCPGQVIPVAINCINRSTEEIELKVALKKEISFTARSSPGRKYEKSKILEEKRGPVPPHVTKSFTIELMVPEMEVHNLRNCSFIGVEYELKITVSPDGCHDDSEESCNLIFGTIPLGGSQTIQNPHTITATQAYPQAITQQPYPQYANPSPHPPPVGFPTNSYPPHPYPTSPFPPNPYPPSPQQIALQASPNPMAAPNQTSSYPQSPYPPGPPQGPGSPYPPGPPQRAGSSPYPLGPPQGAGSSPYPPGPPQGPGSPYPSGPPQGPGSPYPSGPPQGPGSPYPSGPPQGPGSPYPSGPPQGAGSSPYPPGPPQGADNPPYPITPPSNQYSNPPTANPTQYTSVTTGLKTGTFGFVHGDEKNVDIPLLPAGAAVPMPKPDPYMPSAPVPSTPDDVTKPLMSQESLDKSPPAYNPNI